MAKRKSVFTKLHSHRKSTKSFQSSSSYFCSSPTFDRLSRWKRVYLSIQIVKRRSVFTKLNGQPKSAKSFQSSSSCSCSSTTFRRCKTLHISIRGFLCVIVVEKIRFTEKPAMSALIRSRSRIFAIVSRSYRRFFSESRERIISSSTILNEPPPPPETPEPPPPASGAEKKPWSFLKYGLMFSLTGGVAASAYATYDEVDQKTKAFRSSANYTVGDDASSLDKILALLRCAAMTVPAKLIELYIDLRRLTEDQVRGFVEPTSDKLLPDLHPLEQHAFTLVLDLNETLIFSDWKRDRGWRTFKRPGVDAFLEHLAQFYEIVVYSDQLSMYVDPVVETLDPKNCIRFRLSRGATRYVDGKHYRDLSKLNRNPTRVIYISGHALESSLQKENAVQIKPWQGEAEDTALLDLIPFLEYVAKSRPPDIRTVLASYQGRAVAQEFIERSKEYQNVVWRPSQDDELTIMDVRKFTPLHKRKFNYEVNEIAWNVTGDLFFLTTGNGTVEVLAYPSLQAVDTLMAHTAGCYCIAIDPLGRYFAVGSADSLVSLWDIKEMLCVRTFTKFEWPVRTVSFNHDGEYIASASEDLFIDISNVQTGRLVHQIPCRAAMNSVEWNPKYNLLAYAGDDKNKYQADEGVFRIFGFESA